MISYKYQPLPESLQCQRTGRTLVICDAFTSQQNLECSFHSKGEQTPQGWGCSSSTALQLPHPAGWHPHLIALGQPHPELSSTHRCGGLSFTNTGRVRLECREPLGVSRRKCTATAPIPKIWASLPNIPQTAQSYRAPLHTSRDHTDSSAEDDLLVWIKYLEEIKKFPLQTAKKLWIWKKPFKWTKCSHWCHW